MPVLRIKRSATTKAGTRRHLIIESVFGIFIDDFFIVNNPRLISNFSDKIVIHSLGDFYGNEASLL